MWDESPRPENGNVFRDDYGSFNDYNEQRRGSGLAAHTYEGLRQMEQTSATSARERFTQTGMNPYATLHYINRELMELGLPSPLLLPELPECLEDNQRVVECLLALVEKRKADAEFREHTEDAMRVAMGEEDSLRATIGRLERELGQAQRAAAMANVRLKESERIQDAKDQECKALATELRVTRANAASTKTQYVHEAKKRELEAGKLKERMQKLLVDKHRSAKVMFVLANDVVRDRSGRPVDAVTHEQLMLEDLVGKYESNEQQLVKRIVRLEETLRQLGGTLGKLHAAVLEDEDEDEAVQVVVERDGSVDMAPFVAMFESIRKAVSDERRRQQELSAADPAELVQRDTRIRELEAEVQALSQEIADQRRIMAEQKKVMEMAGRFGATDALNASFSGMSLEELEIERSALRQEKEMLEEKRRQFTEAYLELGNERQELQRERNAFETLRSSTATRELLADMPPTPQWIRNADMSMSTPMLINRLQTSDDGTPTNAFLSSPRIASNGSPAQPAAPLASSDMDVDDEQQAMRTGVKRSAAEPGTPSSRSQSRARGESTPTKPQGTRTPVEVRSGKQPRVCTRPGCAAHAPHSHDDGSPAPRMELKPPVPRFRRRTDTDESSAGAARRPASQATSAATLPARPGSSRPAPTTAGLRRPPSAARPAGPVATQRKAAPGAVNARTHAAEIFK